jgi:hypothetical protein
VGTAGFLIDLAVVDSQQRGRYLLGVECDGASYHSARWARDRDRLREQVLKDRGWNIHRIWSTDWFHRPKEQLTKLLGAIEQAQTRLAAENAQQQEARSAEPTQLIKRDMPSEDQGPPENGAKPYQEANFAVPRETAIHELSINKLVTVIRTVVDIEGPVHRDEVCHRVATLWGHYRLGSRMEDAIIAAINVAVRAQALEEEEKFLSMSDQREVVVRNREHVQSPGLKRPEYFPPAEVRTAICQVVSRNVGVQKDDVPAAVARLFGFRTTSSQIREIVERQLERLLESGRLILNENRLFVAVDAEVH